MFQSKLSPVVKGMGVNPDVGGFATIIINGKPYPAHVVADAVEALSQSEDDGVERYPLHAVIFKSHNGQHWTLKLSGTIKGVSFEAEHYQPLTVVPERVAELRSHYDAVGFIERLQHQTEPSESRLPLEIDVDDSPKEILQPNEQFAIAKPEDIAIRDARIAELEKVIEQFEDQRGKDWLELHDQLIIAEKKATVFQEDVIRLNNRGKTFNWLIGEISEEPAAGS